MAALDVVALVRAEDDKQAQRRVLESLRERRVQAPEVSPGLAAEGRVFALAADLTKGDLGLVEGVHGELRVRVTHIIHVRWLFYVFSVRADLALCSARGRSILRTI